VWVLVVGFTGMLNTWADLLLKLWQFKELSAMTAAYKGHVRRSPSISGSD
jgi:hypothetical protein